MVFPVFVMGAQEVANLCKIWFPMKPLRYQVIIHAIFLADSWNGMVLEVCKSPENNPERDVVRKRGGEEMGQWSVIGAWALRWGSWTGTIWKVLFILKLTCNWAGGGGGFSGKRFGAILKRVKPPGRGSAGWDPIQILFLFKEGCSWPDSLSFSTYLLTRYITIDMSVDRARARTAVN